MKKTTVFLMLTLAIASCYSDVNRPPLATTSSQKLTTKEKFSFSKKAYFEYNDEDGNFIGNGYGYRPDPISCNEAYNILIANSPDEEVSVYVNDKLVLKRATPRGPEFIYNDDTYLHFYLNYYLNNGKNTIKYEVFNKTGGYSWDIKLKPYKFELSSVDNNDGYVINDVQHNESDTSKENQIVRTRTLDIYTCKPEEPVEETQYCGTNYDSKGKPVETCLVCKEGEEVVFDGSVPLRCKSMSGSDVIQDGLSIKSVPYGDDGINVAALLSDDCVGGDNN